MAFKITSLDEKADWIFMVIRLTVVVLLSLQMRETYLQPQTQQILLY